ncbi:M81 family metallopeptidase [Streptomyces chartreusis]|uniref:M81 family metallopeptidase n=1 Tax=Streptomyces chartreusis TaxID=1969 RepID=UPI0033FBCB34
MPQPRPVLAIAGLGIESSTFSPARTEAPAFHPLRGQDVLSRYPFLAPGEPLREAADWRGALVGKALPGGTVTAAAYAELSTELIDRLRDLGPLDGLWFDIHGAMTVEGLDDAEADLLTRIREVIGPDTLVSTSMDLHGNVSRPLVHHSDLITCYRMAPHEDAMETKERAARNLVDLAGGAPRPVKAWVPVPVLLAGEQTSTRIEPARSVYAAVAEVAAADGVTDAAVWVGYAWADEPRNRAAVVVTGPDEGAVAAGAERLARGFWDARHDFAFVAPTGTLDDCLDEALAAGTRRPYFISDTGDNPTAGGAGDVTWGLQHVLARPEFKDPAGPVVVYASVPGPSAVDAAVRAGVGATVTVTAGAEVDDRHAGPLTMTGVVHSVRHGDRDAETEAVLRVGSVHVILTRLRKPYHLERDFTGLELDPRAADVVIVKIGYLEPELFAMAADWKMALTPGGVDQDLVRLGHRRIHRPMFPFDPAMPDPDLTARIVAPANRPPAHFA